MAMEPDPTPDPEPRFSEQVDALLATRLARRIVAVTMGGALVLGAVAWWLFVMPYDSGGSAGITCGATLDVVEGPAGQAMLDRYEQGCADARERRRNTALVITAVVVVAAATVTTWPSGRLTSGPDGSGRTGHGDGPDDVDDDPSRPSELVRLGLVDTDGRPLAEGEAPPPRDQVAAADDPEIDPAVLEGPAGELIRLGLIDPAEVPADVPADVPSDVPSDVPVAIPDDVADHQPEDPPGSGPA